MVKRKRYPVFQTAPGPDFMKPVPGHTTHNPIKPGDVFKTTYRGKQIRFRLDMSFYTDPNFAVVEILEVKTT